MSKTLGTVNEHGNYPLTVGRRVNDDRYVGHWEKTGSYGTRIWVREKLVPRIPDHYLSCSFFVYKSELAAKTGERYGGSGFLVHVPSVHEGWIHLYAVTNKHVLDGGYHVLRVNTRDGKSEIIPTKPDSWTCHPDGDDIAAMPLDLDGGLVRSWSIGTDKFITRKIESEYYIGPGDETFMVGRLVTIEGLQRNTPVVRFGNVSMSPKEPIQTPDGEREAFLVECRSLSGFSGSPVFVIADRTFYAPDIPSDLALPEQPEGGVRVVTNSISSKFGPWLLGVDFSHMPLWKSVFESDTKVKTSNVVDANTGIACVIPAWRLLTLLQDEDFVKERKKEDEAIAERKNSPSAVVYDVEEKPEFTKEDFENALKKVSKKIEPKK
jgi:hypothetical protein